MCLPLRRPTAIDLLSKSAHLSAKLRWGWSSPKTASRRLITHTAHQIAVGRDASPPRTAGFFLCHRFLAWECVEDDRNLDPCRALARPRTARHVAVHLAADRNRSVRNRGWHHRTA